VDAAAKVAAYVIMRVKEVIDTCGSLTQIVTAKAGQVNSYHSIEIQAWEEAFREFDHMASQLLRQVLTGSEPPISFHDFVSRLQDELAVKPKESAEPA
jgi:hypothetical protein